MSGCLSSSMTGSTDVGPLQPQEDSAPLPAQPSSTFDELASENSSLTRRGRRRRRKMTSTPSAGKAIQLTPLWEHVVRTRRFPSEVDTQATFVEISERLRDPEWEVRQHALRVLMDVLPTLNADAVDKVMQPVVPELINNLGHPAPAVRKGALDTLRVYLVHSPNKDSMVKNILHDGLNRPDAHNPFQTNVTTGVILSAPLLLFPSANSPPPTTQIIKDATIAFASRLVQVPHQEAVLKSLMKIRDVVGEEEFESYLADYDGNMKRNIEVLSKIYNIKSSKKKLGKGIAKDIVKADRDRASDKSQWDSDSDTSGIAEEEDDAPHGAIPGRVVLETEIKFNEKTAITMTILEEKDDEDSDDDDVEGSGGGGGGDEKSAVDVASDDDKRKTPRRVRFGGEIVKLRTPDSDETESIEIMPKTRIPLPVSPATKMPLKRRPSSQPSSPHPVKRAPRRTSRSVSSSPKREYTHNAQLSPKKSILTRPTGPLIVIDSAPEETKSAKNVSKEKKNAEGTSEDISPRIASSSQEIHETSGKEQIALVHTVPSPTSNRERTRSNEKSRIAAAEDMSSKETRAITERENCAEAIDSNGNDISEAPAGQARECAPTKSFGSERKSLRENGNVSDTRDDSSRLEASDFSCKLKNSADYANDYAFGSPVRERDARVDHLIGGGYIDDDQDARISGTIAEDRAAVRMRRDNEDEVLVADSGGERKERSGQRDRKATPEMNESFTCSSSEGEGIPQEPNWEELGLVDQEVLDDLHNKDDWRARVRALERVASALRTSSALIAIESRLGSLLHAVLGGERSCRVAAAGLAVAKIVVEGVSEDALRKKLPQLAWGLARQGGPAAAQLTRITMLRLKPSLLLEQFLQPHCLSARNAKTRENALQLLIFSLVTFPSTEFKLETVASRVATMVADRRRRVRQAALDTLAVLAQVYDSEEVLEASKREADGCPDAEAMLAAVRARLARKSLPLVSADGLVVYGLQISPTVQIATGPDVDWIVAGSGSVSPGTGRTRGQIIATSRSAQGRVSRIGNANDRESPWLERPSLVALGVGLPSRNEQSVAWQILPSQSNADNENEINTSGGRNVNAGAPSNLNLRFEEQLRSSYASSNQPYDSVATNIKNYKEISNNNPEPKARNRRDVNEVAKDKGSIALRGESKIPILSTRERRKVAPQNRTKSVNLEHANSNSRNQLKDALDGNKNRISSQQENVGPHADVHQRQKRLQRENVTSEINETFDSHYGNYCLPSNEKVLATTNREHCSVAENKEVAFSNDNLLDYGRFFDNDKFTDKNENSDHVGNQRSLIRNMQQQILVDTYGSIQERQRMFANTRNAYRSLRTAPNPMIHAYQDFQNFDSQITGKSDVIFRENGRPFSESFTDSHRRRLRSLSPSQLRRSRHPVQLASDRFHATSMYEIDRATANEEECNARNRRHFSPEAKGYHMQNANKEESRYQVERAREPPKSASSSSSDVSRSDRQAGEDQSAPSRRDYSNDNSGSPSPRSRVVNPAFDVITQQTNRQSRDDVDSFFADKAEHPTEVTSAPIQGEASREWSSEDEMKSTTNRIGSHSRRAEQHGELIVMDENCNLSTESSSGFPEQPEDRSSARRRSMIASERTPPYENPQITKELLQSRTASPAKKSEPLYQSPNRSAHHSPISNLPSKRDSHYGSRNLAFENETGDSGDSSEDRLVASTVPDKDASILPLDAVGHPNIGASDSPAIIIASRPHSHEAIKYAENSRSIENVTCGRINAQESTEEESSVNDTLEDRQSKDSASETNTEPGILKIESVEAVEARRRIPSKVPRGTGRYRMLSCRKAAEKPSEKSKRMVQQCFTQLENKDWEVTMKGLKALSQISKQCPECLDVCMVGTIGRLLGRHIKNLRSQVARAACLAAGDVFSSQIRGVDQDLDEIAGPLLHRTADTNRFLRADSNAALDQMVQNLPPHKTISIIVLRGASHQNAIVRAATARLLSDVTDRIGPDHIMILPRDVRDKLLNAGAKLLMDGNLDARNHAKKMFRRLTRCEGFRKALTDAVPETTLRHIDKTLKAL